MTTAPATWLADVLRAVGVRVVETPGWKTRGRPPSTGGFVPRSVMWHHDASSPGDSPNVPAYIIAGRPAAGEPGPLAQLWVDRPGVWHVLAAGRCNHAGDGQGWGIIPADLGNTYAIGVETDHTTGEAWPDAQLVSLRVGTAAILERLKASPMLALCGHKEYAPDRKTDPDGLDLDSERRKVAALMDGEDDMSPADVWKYAITSLIDGKDYSAARMLQLVHKRTYDTTLAVGALQAQVDALATAAQVPLEVMTAAADKGVTQAMQRIAADIADGA